MRHHACAAVIGFLTAAILAPVNQSHAASADPTGYWMKPDAERESKIHVFKCGKNKSHLCAKIAWLKEPNDKKGQPLHDVRNESPSMRGRPIVGLPIFSALVPSAPSTWTGKIYNPEDGHTYSATLTVVSRKQILLRGCKAWLLCGEKQWLRTTAPEQVLPPAAPAEGTQQIEASLTPEKGPAAPPVAQAAATVATEQAAPGQASPVSKASIDAAAAQEEMKAMTAPQAVPEPSPAMAAAPEQASPVTRDIAAPSPAMAVAPAQAAPVTQTIAAPAAAPAEVDTRQGYGFLTVGTDPESTARLSGENVSSMILMTEPIATGAAAAAQPAAKAVATPSAEPARLPAPKPKAPPKPVATAAAKPVATAEPKPVATAAKPVATAAPKPAAKAETPASPAEQATPAPQDGDAALADADSADAVPAETAEATLVEPVPLTRKQRRLLRKQQREMEQDPLLPWLR